MFPGSRAGHPRWVPMPTARRGSPPIFCCFFTDQGTPPVWVLHYCAAAVVSIVPQDWAVDEEVTYYVVLHCQQYDARMKTWLFFKWRLGKLYIEKKMCRLRFAFHHEGWNAVYCTLDIDIGEHWKAVYTLDIDIKRESPFGKFKTPFQQHNTVYCLLFIIYYDINTTINTVPVTTFCAFDTLTV